jgi:hypothetical protein
MFARRLAIALLLALAPAAQAQDSVKGLRIVVPDARGKAAFGKAQLSKALRRTLAEAVGPLIPSKKLEQAQKKLKHKGKQLADPALLAEAARTIDAQYVLAVEITKEKWLYTARAQLINVETGVAQMDFRSQFYKPKAEADDRGKRIGVRALAKMEELAKAGESPKIGVSTGVGAVAQKDPDPAPLVNDRVPSGEDDLKDPGQPTRSDKIDDTPPVGGDTTVAANEMRNPSETSGSSSLSSSSSGSSFSSGGSGTSTGLLVTLDPEEEEEVDDEFFRLTVAGGAGLLRTYDVNAAGVENSRLSYRLAPLALINGDLEISIPGVPLGLLARASFRPVRFEVTIEGNGTSDPNTPRGIFLDTAALLQAPIAVSGEGRTAFRVIPGAGIRYSMLNVSTHLGDIVVDSNSFAPIAMLALRMPINDVLELNLGIDGGLVLGYSESPGETGVEADGGIVIGGDFRARIWLSDAVAIAFDTRFDFEKVDFTGAPSRRLPAGEAIENATITTKDLRTGVGIAFRL